MRVAIVDTGIDHTHPDVGHVSAGIRLSFSSKGRLLKSADYHDVYGHGTACAGIIRSILPACEIVAVRIADGTDQIASGLVAEGIRWAIEDGAKVIVTSLGVRDEVEVTALSQLCAEARKRDIFIVASESNDGRSTYPASCRDAIRVGGDYEQRDLHAFTVDPEVDRRFSAHAGSQKVAWLDHRHLFTTGVSFANARIAGIVGAVVEASPKLNWAEVVDAVTCRALNGEDVRRVRRNQSLRLRDRTDTSWIRRAVIYPFTKETHSLVRFRRLLPFDLVGVVDPPAKRCVGRDAGELIGLESAGLRISADVSAALESADTLILGFTTRLGKIQRRQIGNELATLAVEMGKNVYSFEPLGLDKETLDLAERRNLRIETPQLTEEDLGVVRRQCTELTPIAHIPILGVFGTSSAQGKFTLQMVLRQALSDARYRVSQIGTEHQSILLGMDDCLPIGHTGSGSLLKLNQWSEYFNLRYQRIAKVSNPDIILVGSQGGTVPVKNDTASKAVDQIGSLLLAVAARPDSYVLAVNHLDSFDYIRRTLTALEVVAQGRTIMLALSDNRRVVKTSFGRRFVSQEPVSNDMQAVHLRRLEDRFQIPAVSILDPDTPARAVETIVAAYAGGVRATHL